LELTTKLINAAIDFGSTLVIGRASKVEIEDNKVTGVHVEGAGFIQAEVVIVCLGMNCLLGYDLLAIEYDDDLTTTTMMMMIVDDHNDDFYDADDYD